MSLFLIIAFGCQVGPSYVPPETSVPDSWKTSQNEAIVQETNDVEYWWQIFHDETLNELECYALENNHDLFAAFERVVQARAQAGIAEAHLYPLVDLNPNWWNEMILYRKFFPTRVVREHRRTQQLPFVLTYEVDLWGKLQQAYESAVLDEEAQEDAYQTVILILTTDLAESYYELRTLDADISLLESVMKARAKTVEILAARYRAKIIDFADVSRAELEYSNTKAEYDRIKILRKLEENKIAVLIGLPASDVTITPMPIVGEPPTIPAGMPSDVLLQRPDIAEAERIRAADHARVGVAYASFFPSISLIGALGWSSPSFKDFMTWKSRLWVYGVNSSQVLFDAGELCANFAFAVAKFREADEVYQQIVLEAFQEVEDSLAELEGLSNQYEDITDSVNAAKTTYKISLNRYTKGVTNYLDVVISERDELEAERNLNELLGERFIATVELIKALGGSWGDNCPNY